MSSTKPANLSTTSKDFPQELLDQLNYVISDIYAWISELRGNEGFKHDENSSESYITTADVTFDNLNSNGDVGTQSDQVARGDKGVENGNNHDHLGGDGAQIAYSSLSGTPTTKNFVDRGDPAAHDFSSFTTDGAWHDLDLSSILPAGTFAVLLYVKILDDAAGSYFAVRKNGNSNEINTGIARTQVANIINEAQMTVFVDSGRIVEYKASNLTFTSIDVSVLGWFI